MRSAEAQPNCGFLVVCEDRFFRIATFIEFRTASKAGGRTCRANVLQDHFVAGERFVGPAGTYLLHPETKAAQKQSCRFIDPCVSNEPVRPLDPKGKSAPSRTRTY